MQRRGTEDADAGRDVDGAAATLLDPTRLMIVAVLAQGCRKFVELQRLLGISKGRLFHHLAVLERHGLIEKHYHLSTSDRPRLVLCLSRRARLMLPEALEKLVKLLEAIRENLLEEAVSSGRPKAGTGDSDKRGVAPGGRHC